MTVSVDVILSRDLIFRGRKMFRASRLSELLTGLPRSTFNKLVDQHDSDKHCKGFDSWSHLLAMLYAQLSGARSLREMETGYNAQVHHHYHLGVGPLKRSTMSDANSKRDFQVFADLCDTLLAGAHRKVRQQVKKKMYILDSSPIALKGLGYEWTEARATSRVQGLSVHMMIAPDEQTPIQAKITDSNVTDITAAREMLVPEKGATYVFDRGYYDFNWWHKIHSEGALFVTRLKKNASVSVVKQRKIKAQDVGVILEDAVIQFKNEQTSGGRPKNAYFGKTLRRITVARPDKKTPLILVTNDRKRHASQIAKLYRQRWDIELFFKWLKQNLKLKQFLGRSENAVKIQIYCAIMAYLLTANYQKNQNLNISLRMVLTLFKNDMFSRPESEKTQYQKRKIERDKFNRVQGALDL